MATTKSSFAHTLEAIQKLIEERLDTNIFKSARVEGSNNPGNTTFIFYFFRKNHSGYDMEFAKFNNFRLYRVNGNIEEENLLIEKIVDELQSELLSEYLN